MSYGSCESLIWHICYGGSIIPLLPISKAFRQAHIGAILMASLAATKSDNAWPMGGEGRDGQIRTNEERLAAAPSAATGC